MDSTIADKVSQDLLGIQKKKSEVVAQQAKLDQERLKLEEQEKGLAIALRFYQGEIAPKESSSPAPKPNNGVAEDFASLTIGDAARKILQARSNAWITISQLEKEFLKHGKTSSYNSIDGTLRYDEEGFERQKVGRLNHFRMRVSS
jgi:hypothetical protein